MLVFIAPTIEACPGTIVEPPVLFLGLFLTELLSFAGLLPAVIALACSRSKARVPLDGLGWRIVSTSVTVISLYLRPAAGFLFEIFFLAEPILRMNF